MTYGTLISADEAAGQLGDPRWVFVDCRFTLGDPDAGRRAYLAGHLPGAVFADLDRDLSGPIVPGRTGRHPLPVQDTFERTMTRLGVTPDSQVVAYDAGSGAMAAARLWWLLTWAGHDAVAVLDGGLAHWTATGHPATTADSRATRRAPAELGPAEDAATAAGRPFRARYRPELVAAASDLTPDALAGRTLIDARAADRFRGENETVDPVGGHIPGAINLPFAGNIDPDGRLHPPAALRERYDGTGNPVFYCGSGVSAAHSVLAYRHAGLGMPQLYPGSWSEWITSPGRPRATHSPEAGRSPQAR
jgi:thiosulfate/3-mercaptopyruvate sulfurtransferase